MTQDIAYLLGMEMDKWNFPHPKLLSILFLFSVCVALYNNATITYVSELYVVPAGFMNLYICVYMHMYTVATTRVCWISLLGPCFVHPEYSRHSIFIVINLMQCAGHRNGDHQQQTCTFTSTGETEEYDEKVGTHSHYLYSIYKMYI